MRLRRIGFKVLTLVVAFAIVLIVSFSYLSSNASNAIDDAFLTHLPTLQAETAPEISAAQTSDVLNNTNLLNLTAFQYILPNNLCQKYNKELLAIIIVTSYVGHDELRAAHRQAIAQSKLSEMGFQRVFLLAAIPQQERFIAQKQLQHEQARFGDLLQGNFQEAYRNLTYKHVMGLRWAATECNKSKFIIKIDDDIVFDIFHLRRYLETLELQEAKLVTSANLLAGYVLDARPAIRNAANKWYVSKAEYKEATYPAYLSGWLYITNPSTALRLVQQAQRTAYFWIDDTWVTGILRAQLGIPMQHLNEWYSANAEFMNCCVRDLKQANFECEFFVGPNGGNSKLIIEFLHNVEKCYFDECNKRMPEKALKKTCVGSAKHFLPEHGEALVRQIRLR